MGRIVACLLALLFSTPAFAQEKCELTLLASFNAVVIDDGRFYVPVKINGKHYYFMMDTGGLANLLRENIVSELKLPITNYASRHERASLRDKEVLRDAGGGSVLKAAIVPLMELGAIQEKNEKFAIMPDTKTPLEGEGQEARIAGSLGQNFLMKYDVEFDPLNKKVRIFSQDHCRGNVVYWSKSFFEIPFKQKIALQDNSSGIRFMRNRFRDFNVTTLGEKNSPPFGIVKLDGKRLQASIDTGSGISLLDLGKARSSFDLDPEEDRLARGPDAHFVNKRGVETYIHQFKTLEFGNVSFNNPTFHLLDLAKGADVPRMIIGMDKLRNMRFYIAYKENIIYGTPANATLDAQIGGQAVKPSPNSP